MSDPRPRDPRPRLVYIAGPFRAATAWDVECNIRRAEELGLEVARIGGLPVIPHAMTRFYNGQRTDSFWLDGMLELMRRCDAVLMVPTWRESRGASAEHDEAERLALPLFYDLETLHRYLDGSMPACEFCGSAGLDEPNGRCKVCGMYNNADFYLEDDDNDDE